MRVRPVDGVSLLGELGHLLRPLCGGRVVLVRIPCSGQFPVFVTGSPPTWRALPRCRRPLAGVPLSRWFRLQWIRSPAILSLRRRPPLQLPTEFGAVFVLFDPLMVLTICARRCKSFALTLVQVMQRRSSRSPIASRMTADRDEPSDLARASTRSKSLGSSLNPVNTLACCSFCSTDLTFARV